jgi:hypothetical protein
MFLRSLLVSLPLLALASISAAEPPAADSSSPKSTARSFYQLIAAGKTSEALQLFATPTTDAEKDLLQHGVGDDLYAFAMFIAIKEKFPDATVPDAARLLKQLAEVIDRMEEKVDGDRVTLAMAASEGPSATGPAFEPIPLKKEGNEWKLAIAEGRFLKLPPPQVREFRAARIAAINGFIADVRAGKFATNDEARQEMQRRYQVVQEKFGPAPPPMQ